MDEDDIRDYCRNITPRFYAGVRDKTIEDYPLFFRDNIFGNTPIVTDREIIYWDEVAMDHRTFMPPTVCPCDDVLMVPDSDDFERHFVKPAYWQLGYNVDCDFNFQVQYGESEDGDTGLGAAIDRSYARKLARTERGFRLKEELWAAMMVTKQKVVIEGPGIKPYELAFPRHKGLNNVLTGEECWGKDSCNAMSSIELMDNCLFQVTGGSTTHIIMNPETCALFRQSKDVQDCIKAFNPGIFLGQSLINDQSREPRTPYRGAKLQFTLGESGIQVWCVNSLMKFCDPITGAEADIELLKTGQVIGLDLSNSDTGYGGTFAYGAIRNMRAGSNRARQRFTNQWVTPDGKSMKGSMESAPIPIVMCKDASWEMNVCGGK